MKKTLLLLCGLLGYVGGMFAAVDDTFSKKVKLIKDGTETTVSMVFKVLTEDEDAKTGTVQVGKAKYSSVTSDQCIPKTTEGSVTIPAEVAYNGITYTVTTIHYNAFYSCKGLTAIEIPNTVVEIRSGAFSSCIGLTSIDIPEGVTSVTGFTGCRGLTSVKIPEGTTEIGSGAFSYCTGLASIEIPSKVTKIATCAFDHCDALTSVVIPDNVKFIDQSAFDYCAELQSIYIGSGVDSIRYTPLSGCDKLVSIEVSEDNPKYYSENNSIIRRADKFLLQGCNTTIIPSDIKTIGYEAFRDFTLMKSIDIPQSVRTIGSLAFYRCLSLEAINIPNSVTSIGSGTFEYCTSLKSINLPASISEIQSSTFMNSGLVSINIPEGVTNIDFWAFQYCNELENVTIPSTLKRISSYCFKGCESLKSVVSYATTPPSLNGIIFKESNYTDAKSYNADAILYVPKGSKSLYEEIYQWKDFKEIIEFDDFELNVTQAMFATFYLSWPVEVPNTNADILGIYTARQIDGNELLLDKIEGDIVPAMTPTLVFANPGKYNLQVHHTDKKIEIGNIMKGVLEATPVADIKSEGNYDRILTLGRGKTGGFIGFYNYTKDELAANKCYIGLNESVNVTGLKLLFPDGTETGIESLNANDNANEGVYDLSGRRVSNTSKGLYIMNGKKVVKK